MAMTQTPDNDPAPPAPPKPGAAPPPGAAPAAKPALPKEIGGPSGPEPTRFGDWERKGRVSDF
jgi:homeobox protein ESX1